MKKNLTSSTQTAGAKANGAASITLKINDPAVLRYIRQVSKKTGLTQRHIAAELLRSGTAQAAKLYPADGKGAAK